MWNITPLIQIILHIKKDSIYMGKHLELTLDRFYILWSIFPSIYALKGDNHTYDYFSICLVFFWAWTICHSFSYSCGALYKIRSIFLLRIERLDVKDFQSVKLQLSEYMLSCECCQAAKWMETL